MRWLPCCALRAGPTCAVSPHPCPGSVLAGGVASQDLPAGPWAPSWRSLSLGGWWSFSLAPLPSRPSRVSPGATGLLLVCSQNWKTCLGTVLVLSLTPAPLTSADCPHFLPADAGPSEPGTCPPHVALETVTADYIHGSLLSSPSTPRPLGQSAASGPGVTAPDDQRVQVGSHASGLTRRPR